MIIALKGRKFFSKCIEDLKEISLKVDTVGSDLLQKFLPDIIHICVMVILTILTLSAINFTDLLRRYFLIFIVFDDYLSSELSSVLSFVTLKIVLITILFMFLCIILISLFTTSMKIQFYVLGKHFSKDVLGGAETENSDHTSASYQQEVQEKLRFCINQHIRLLG
jgi:hypothetical protein